MRAFDPLSSPLLTDLYQLTMLQGYFVSGMNGVASFELFVRRMPRDRAFLVAAGLESVLEYLENLRFGEPELGWMKRSGLFRSDFIDWLGMLRFDGMVEAMEEGTIFFANEPILRITAPISQAQLIESRIVNIMHFQSLVASKAARSVRAILDAGGLSGAIIFASGNLDEHRIAALEREGAPIDAYGIGTALVTSADAPSLDMVYKLQELDGAAKRKRSPGKATWPGRKQVFRFFDSHGRFEHDEVTLMSDHRHGEPLLRPVMREGRRLRPMIPLESNRAFAMQSLEQLPANLRQLNVEYQLYHVAIGQSVRNLTDAVDQDTMA